MTTQKELESIRERVQKAGLTMDELREAVGGTDRTILYERIRAAGLTLDEARCLCSKKSDVDIHLTHEKDIVH